MIDTSDTITNDKQKQLRQNFACLTSFKNKMDSYPKKRAVTIISNNNIINEHLTNQDENKNANIFNTNLSFCSIDLNLNMNVTSNILHRTNGSFRFPLNYGKDTITSFYSRDFNINDGLFFVQNNSLIVGNSNIDGGGVMIIEDGSESTKKQTAMDVEESDDGDNHLLKNKREMNMACIHFACESTFKTLKQKLAHHHKMSPECKKDTIHLLTSIRKLKILIKALNKKKKIKEDYECNIKELYEKTMKGISMTEHVQMNAGMKFDDN